MLRLASARLYDPKKSRTSRQVAAGDICDVDEKKDATSKSLTGARGPTHRSEIFHGVDCLSAQRITAHLVSERGGGVRLGSRGTSFYYPLSTGDDIFGVARGVARTSGTHESNEGCPDRASRRAPRGKPTAHGFGNPSAARSPSSRYMPTASCFFTRRSDTEKRRSRPRGFTRPPPQTGRPSIPTKGTARTRSSGNESTRWLKPSSR